MSSCNCNCSELENPPTKGNMGVFQIIELALMIIVGVLCVVDLFQFFKYNTTFNLWAILIIVMDVCIVVGLVLIFIGLFCAVGSRKIKTGIILFFVGALIAIVFIFYNIFNAFTFEYFIVELVKGALLIFVAILLWKQSNKLA